MPCNAFLPIKEASFRTKLSEDTVREVCTSGEVHAHKLAGTWRVEVTEQGFLAERPERCLCITPQLGEAVPQLAPLDPQGQAPNKRRGTRSTARTAAASSAPASSRR